MSVSLAAIAALGSVASAGLGAGLSAVANDDAIARLAADQAEDRRHYARLLNRDYVNSSENQSILRKLRELQKENYNRARATNVVAGGTDAHLAAMQREGGQVVTDTANALASRASAYKDKVLAAKRASERAYAQQMFGLDMQKSQNIANAAGQATAAMAKIAAGAGEAQNPYSEAEYESAGKGTSTRPLKATENLNVAKQEAAQAITRAALDDAVDKSFRDSVYEGTIGF